MDSYLNFMVKSRKTLHLSLRKNEERERFMEEEVGGFDQCVYLVRVFLCFCWLMKSWTAPAVERT